MPLTSALMAGDNRLERTLVDDTAHVESGESGDYVSKIQTALNNVNAAGLTVSGSYDDDTASAVFDFKTTHGPNGGPILGPGEIKPDQIVGKRTIKELDRLQKVFEDHVKPAPPPQPPVGVADVYINAIERRDVLTSYYNNCGLETIGPARISTNAPVVISSFEDMIDRMTVSASPHQVVVCHGNSQFGLLVRLAPETPHHSRTGRVIGGLSDVADSLQAGDDPDDQLVSQLAREIQASKDVVLRVAGKLVALRLSPKVYHFRACNITDFQLMRKYKSAFGALGITFHPCRLLFLTIQPHQQPQPPTVVQLKAAHPDNFKSRGRLESDPASGLDPALIGVDDIDGHTRVKVFTMMDVFTSAEVALLIQRLIDRWIVPNPTQFVVPVMWDDGQLTFHFPREDGWREMLNVI